MSLFYLACSDYWNTSVERDKFIMGQVSILARSTSDSEDIRRSFEKMESLEWEFIYFEAASSVEAYINGIKIFHPRSEFTLRCISDEHEVIKFKQGEYDEMHG